MMPSAALAVVALLAGVAAATTVVPMSDESLVRGSSLVVLGTVRRIESVELAGPRFATRITLAVEETVKGRAAGDEVVVTEPGGTVGGRGAWIFGAPEFAVGERVVVFLTSGQDGTLRTNALGLGKYGVEADGLGGLRARRGVIAPDARPLGGFLARLGALAAGEGSGGASPVSGGETVAAVGSADHESFTFIGTTPARWFEPNDAVPVQMRLANFEPAFGPTVSTAAVDAAMAAWTAVATATITIQNAGGTLPARSVAAGVCDGSSRVQFADPFEEVPDLNGGCQGVVAVGGFCRNSETRVVDGTTFQRILEGDVTVNDAGACFGSLLGSMTLAQVLTHEIGHTIGLGHSSENPSEPDPVAADATMYFLVHNDDRGAAVREDDVAGVSAIYPPDGDGDRVFDPTDACPGTARGLAVDQSGCACADPGHIACEDADVCTIDGCDGPTGLCRHDPLGCDDGDPCTDDACAPVAGCEHTARTGTAATTCAFEPRLASPVCGGWGAPAAASKRFNQAGTLVARAQGARPQRTKRLLRQAAAAVRKAAALVARAGRRRPNPLSADCVATLNAILAEAERVLHAAGV